MSRFNARLRRLEAVLEVEDPNKACALFLDIPGGKPPMMCLGSGGCVPCLDVAAVLAQRPAVKLYRGIDPDWL